MPATYTSLHYHLVFSTKNREPMIADRWQSRFHEHLSTVVRGLQGLPLAIGGMSDHVHLLVGLKATHCLADFIRDLKKESTHWVMVTLEPPDFGWHEGYTAISISPMALEAVRAHILNQEAHHRQRTHREELVEMLIQAGIPFNERHLD